MKTNQLFSMLFLVFLGFSCTTKQKDKTENKVTSQEYIAPPQVTIIADLPDSLQPKTVYLDKTPPPKVVAVPKDGGIKKMLPVLQNQNGEPILDADGKPYFLGDGGISNFTNLTTDNGLALDNVTCSLLDRFGNLWFGTLGGGVSRYDGKSFVSFTTAQGLAQNIVRTIFEDKAGNLWFGTNDNGVSRYDGKFFVSITTEQGLANNSVWSILEDKAGNFWFGTMGGVSIYAPSALLPAGSPSFASFTIDQGLANNRVWDIFEDRAGNLWFGTQGGVSRYDPSASLPAGFPSFVSFTTVHGLATNDVSSILEDKAGNLWFGTQDGVSRYDPSASHRAGTPSFVSFTTAQGLANNFVSSILEDKAGNLWFGTGGGGVSRYDGKSFVSFTTAQGLANNRVSSILEDKEGNLWFGIRGEGVSRYDPSASLPAGSPSFVNFTTDQGLASNIVFSMLEDKAGNLWFGTGGGGGVSRYDPSASLGAGSPSFVNFTTAQGLAGNSVSRIMEDKAGNLWFGTLGRGVSRFDGKSFVSFTTAQGLANNAVICILEDRAGNLWFGTRGGGVSRYDPSASLRGGAPSFVKFTTAQGLADNLVSSILEDKAGNLWFGTAEGLSMMGRLEHSKIAKGTEKGTINLSEKPFKSFKITDGLPDNFVTQVIQMPDGRMAVGTNQGITFFNTNDDFSRLTDIVTYNSNTGYPVKDVSLGQNALFLDSKGIIWAATGNEKTGLVRFDPESLKTNMQAPTLIIQAIKVNDEPIDWYHLKTKGKRKNQQDSATAILQEFFAYGKNINPAEKDSLAARFAGLQFDSITPFYPVPQNLILPYEHNQIAFEFAAIETSRPFLVKYQYMLQGYDKDWSPITSRSNANFGNISEGTYTFKLKAQGANGVWTDPITYTFNVLPPWWRTWWAYTLYILIFAFLVWLLIQSQKRKAAQKEREKARDKELAQAKEIEKAYAELGLAHENLKSTQAQLIQSEKMASLGELTAGIAHEIQNPLNFVNNFSELNQELIAELDEELEKGNTQEAKVLTKDLKENEQKITHHGKRADAIVKGMLEHSRASSGEKITTDLNALADEYLKLSYHGMRAKDRNFNAEFETQFDPNLPNINVVPQDIGRVLLNLFNNAFYACSQSNPILNHNSPLINHNSPIINPNSKIKNPQITVTTKNLGDKIQISVSDNGPGIPDAIKDKIFQPFFTTKPTGQGTGLGLSLAYDIVKAHGGELTLDSNEEVGTQFSIKIPIT